PTRYVWHRPLANEYSYVPSAFTRASKRVILERCNPKSLATSAAVFGALANGANDLLLLVRAQFGGAAHLSATIPSCCHPGARSFAKHRSLELRKAPQHLHHHPAG